MKPVKRFIVEPRTEADGDGGKTVKVSSLGIGKSAVYQLRHIDDARGKLSVGEFEREIPFVPKRYFLIADVPAHEVRGTHAHRTCHQFLICIRGSCCVLVDDGRQRCEVVLDRPDLGVYLPPMTWGSQHDYSPDAILLVFASEHYDPDEYIQSYEEFCAISGGGG